MDRYEGVPNESSTRSRDWPNSPDALSNRLRRAATFLRKVGVEISFDRGSDKQRSRTITISIAPKVGVETASEVSEVSAKSNTAYNVNDLSSDTLIDADDPEVSDWRDQASAAPSSDTSMRSPSPSVRPSVRLNPLKDKASDTSDTSDATPPPISGAGRRAHMTALALQALAAAKAAGITVILDGDGLILEPAPSPALIERLKAVKPDLLRVLAGREAARAIINTAEEPPGCLPHHWVVARRGLRRFVQDGWADSAALFGWTLEELYRVPPAWGRVDLTGAALLIGDRRAIAVSAESIVIETRRGVASQVPPSRARACGLKGEGIQMGRIKSQLRYGQWPESREPAHHHVGLTVAARRLAASVLEELGRLGVVATLDDEGRARFRATRTASREAKLMIERHGDLIEAYLIERAPRLAQS